MPVVLGFLLFVLMLICIAITFEPLGSSAAKHSKQNSDYHSFLSLVEQSRCKNIKTNPGFCVKALAADLLSFAEKKITLDIRICDITAGLENPLPVIGSTKEHSQTNVSYLYTRPVDTSELANTNLSWITLADIETGDLKFPRQGQRKLKFDISFCADDKPLANSVSIINHTVEDIGFVDAEEARLKLDIYAVQLALAVCAAEWEVNTKGVAFIESWIENKSKQKLKSILKMELYEGVKFYQNDGFYNIDSICRKLLEKSRISQRYKIAELCLQAVCHCDSRQPTAAKLLWKIAAGLKLNKERFIAIVQKIKPFDMSQPTALNFTLGITEDMDSEQTRNRLNSEYRKWNCRVNNSDKFIKEEVEQMLDLIAQARSRYADEPQCSMAASS